MTAFINALREEGTKEDCLAAVERLWDQLTAARLAGKIEGMEIAAISVRAACGACGGSGYAGDDAECEYCGRPMLAIRAKIAELEATLKEPKA